MTSPRVPHAGHPPVRCLAPAACPAAQQLCQGMPAGTAAPGQRPGCCSPKIGRGVPAAARKLDPRAGGAGSCPPPPPPSCPWRLPGTAMALRHQQKQGGATRARERVKMRRTGWWRVRCERLSWWLEAGSLLAWWPAAVKAGWRLTLHTHTFEKKCMKDACCTFWSHWQRCTWKSVSNYACMSIQHSMPLKYEVSSPTCDSYTTYLVWMFV